MASEWEEHSRQRRENGKIFRDPLYNYVTLSPVAAAALDTPPLQRLRHLKQLGCASAVYPCAEHSRFVHSLGVAHLANEMLMRLREAQPELEVSPGDATVVELAALCHDIGHGPFSHVFEAEFLKKLGIEWSHEEMSGRLIDAVADDAALDLEPSLLRGVKDLVCAGKAEPLCDWEGREFMRQIVANPINGVDVDKFDYLRRDAWACGIGGYDFAGPLTQAARVFDGRIAFKSGMEPKLHGLFMARAEMHQQVYTHRKVKCVEYLVVDAMRAANGPLRITERLNSPADFVGLTDAILLEARNSPDPALAEAAALVRRIERRDVYAFCAEVEVPQDRALEWPPMTEQEVAGHQDHNLGVALTPGDIRVHNLKIDFSMGGAHPARRVPIWHRDGTVEGCSELPFSPTLCLQRKVRVYLAKQTADAAARAAAIKAVQSAFASAVRARLGAAARVALGGERPAGAPARSGLSASAALSWPRPQASGGAPAGQSPVQQPSPGPRRRAGAGDGSSPYSLARGPAGQPDPAEALPPPAVDGAGAARDAAAGGGGCVGRGGAPPPAGARGPPPVASTPEKQPPPKRRLGSPAAGADASSGAGVGAGGGGGAAAAAAAAAEDDGGGSGDEDGVVCTQGSASVGGGALAATKRRKGG
ncbi:hypothetical protein Rsub_03852 [Raphidocelis subcapitata]|uniref:HD domain-containing protein n=1 Tax=Raphidocelis subcapitata TaxID=307507 RepID=A0A2V0P1C5_9CHLO|nr:hypothetical protein Rsub_03852 [Raphidocelis subcapitata]|eukprot:GBF90997.1 hypothetical protein Rsub_03852 [Raphidocelis subcapitata]